MAIFSTAYLRLPLSPIVWRLPGFPKLSLTRIWLSGFITSYFTRKLRELASYLCLVRCLLLLTKERRRQKCGCSEMPYLQRVGGKAGCPLGPVTWQAPWLTRIGYCMCWEIPFLPIPQGLRYSVTVSEICNHQGPTSSSTAICDFTIFNSWLIIQEISVGFCILWCSDVWLLCQHIPISRTLGKIWTEKYHFILCSVLT